MLHTDEMLCKISAVSFIHSPSIHLDACLMRGTVLGIRKSINTIFQNVSKLKKIIQVCWNWEQKRGRKVLQELETPNSQKELNLRREMSEEAVEFCFQ